MSVFQVQFNKNTGAPGMSGGYVSDPAFATAYTTTATTVTSGSSTYTVLNGVGGSAQKSMDVTGPNLTRRRLYDVQVFTSTNYWKRYASVSQGGAMAKLSDGTDPSFIYVVSDDGSPYSDKDRAVNKAAYVWTCQLASTSNVPNMAASSLNVVTQYGGPATYCQIMINTYDQGTTAPSLAADVTGSVKCLINTTNSTQTVLSGTSTTLYTTNTATTSGSIIDIFPATANGGGQIFDNYDLPITYLSFWLPQPTSNTVYVEVEVLLTVELISKD